MGGAQAREHGLDHAGDLEAEAGVEHRRVADLHVADVLAGDVLGELVGDAVERVLVLHHAQGHVEGLEVLDERAAVLAQVHHPAQLGRVSRRELDPVDARQIEDRLEAERAVEMNVQIRLGSFWKNSSGSSDWPRSATSSDMGHLSAILANCGGRAGRGA